MNNHTLIRYAFDPTGNNLDNLVQNEPHTLADKRFRAIAPVYGVFYTEGFSVIDTANKQLLIRGQDYVFAELHQALTLELGKEIAGVVIVTNVNVSSDVVITYQCVGGNYSVDSSTFESLLAKKSDDEVSKDYYDIENRPAVFTPSPHLHDLGDVDGMETLIYELERIRNIIVWSDSNSIESLMQYVIDTIDSLTAHLIHRVNVEFLALVISYKKSFTKSFVGLSKVENYPLASAQDGAAAFDEEYDIGHKENDKYVSTEALSAFKEVLYSVMVSSNVTQLGKTYGTLIRSTLAAINNIPVGASFMLDTIRNNKSYGVEFDYTAYPDDTVQTTRWVITKLAQKVSSNGSVLMGINASNGELYTGQLKVSSTGAVTIQWSKHMNETDTEGYLDKLLAHINDNNNPHKTRKKSVLLGDVENLPVASKEDIICRKPVRKYITYDGLLLYAKAFLTGIKDESDIEQDDEDVNVLEQYQLIFAPCGPCGGLKQTVVTVNQEVYIVTPQMSWVYPTATYDESGNLTESSLVATEGTSLTNPQWLIDSYDVVNEPPPPVPEPPPPPPLEIVENEDNFTFNMDYLAIEYYFSDGMNLDTRTAIILPFDSGDYGWARNNNTNESENVGVFWGGDNTGIGKECTYIDLAKVKENYPNTTSIRIRCRCFWYNQKGTRPVSLKITGYRGGTMEANGYSWSNPTAEATREFETREKIITVKESSNIDGELFCYINYDYNTNICNIEMD